DREETEKMRLEIYDLKTSARVFQVCCAFREHVCAYFSSVAIWFGSIQSTRCVACGIALDLPSVHFLCMHSYHQRCLGDDRECPRCAADAKRVMERKAQFDAQMNQHEQFFKELEGAKDGFSTVAQ